jgi:hypothetical protein
MKTIKQGLVFPAALAFAVGWSFTLPAQTVQIGNLQVQVANIQPVDSNSIPDSGTFYLLQDALDSGGAPYPDDPVPQFPVYSLGIDGLFLVDNTGITDETLQQILAPLFIIPDPNAPGAPPISWPVSLDGLPLVDPTNVPECGTFYLYQDQFASDPPDPPPYPVVPDFAQSAPVYALSTNDQFLIDDTGLTRPDPGPMPEYTPPNYGSSLALIINGISNYVAYLTLTNTLAGTNYDILYKQNLSDPTWGYVGTITGATNQTATPFIVPVGDIGSLFFWAEVTPAPPGDLYLEIPSGGFASGQLTVVIQNTIQGQPYDVLTSSDLTIPMASWSVAQSVSGATGNSTAVQLPVNGQGDFFVCARFGGDTQDIGIPDWWQLNYFGYVGVDPFALDSSGDGWTILDDYQKGFVPGTFHTALAPAGLTEHLNPDGSITLSWLPSPGAVTGYTVFAETQSPDPYASASLNYYDAGMATTYVDTNVPPYTPIYFVMNCAPVYYEVQARYSGGSSSWAYLPAGTDYFPVAEPEGWMIPGPGTSTVLAFVSLPSAATSIHLTRTDLDQFQNPVSTTTLDIPVSALATKLYTLPDSFITEGPNISLFDAQAVIASGQSSEGFEIGWPGPGYSDGRIEMKQNAMFLLQAAGLNGPLFYTQNGITVSQTNTYAWVDQLSAVDNPPIPGLGYLGMFSDNYRYRNFVFSTSDIDTNSGFLNTGYNLRWDSTIGWYISLEGYLQYTFNSLSPLNPQLSSYTYNTPYNDPTLLGITVGSEQFSLPNNIYNWFGLHLSSVLAVHANQQTGIHYDVLPANGSISKNEDTYYFYPQFDQPELQTAGYYFGKQYSFEQDGGYGSPFPGDTNFAPGSQTPLLIAAVGQPSGFEAFAAQTIANGDQTKPVYVRQYFASAYKMDASGHVTGTQTGVLSPYGMFLPTEPGPAALLTMPDVDTGQQGTGVVYAVKLQLDVNCDGNMDLTFGGPDNTTFQHPFVFWINNDNDGTNVGADVEVNNLNPPDYTYGQIRSQRNLEDFARLWVCGMPALPAGQGYTATLSFQNTFGSPAVNLYWSCESAGGIGYLTNKATAALQIGTGLGATIGTVSNGQSYTFPDTTFIYGGTQHLLFEGAGVGAGLLTLTISQTTSQGSNVLAQTSAGLDLHDVKDFYERAVITNIMTGAKSNWTSTLDPVHYASSSALSDDTNLIVLIHGIDVRPTDWLTESDTVFKRLHWAGYHGQFATVKWPCEYFGRNLVKAGTPINLDLSVFNRSEFKAYKAASALASYLSQLRARFPGYRINLLVHSQGNAITGEAIEQGAPFDTYILTQGAIAASAYDVNAPTDAGLVQQENNTPTPEWQPMGYHGVYTNMSGKIVNFYNPFDPVLGIWLSGQGPGKPDGYLEYLRNSESFPTSYYSYDGSHSWYNAALIIGSYMVTDPQESRAYVSRSRTESIGRQGPAAAHGVVKSAVDLNAQFGFYKAFPDDHSAQWAWPVQTTLPYYRQVLLQIQPGQ